MGFSFRAGHPSDILGEGESAAALLKAQFGAGVPLGTPGEVFTLADEMAWSWWGELQEFAAAEVGEPGSRQIRAVDAWYGVYIDAQVERVLLGERDEPLKAGTPIVVRPPESLWSRLARVVGLKKAGPDAGEMVAAARGAMDEMVRQYGPRAGEGGALQVGNLRVLVDELKALLGRIGVEPSGVEALRRSYSDDDSRCEEDGHIQCLCHAWLTGTHALERGQPLWLVK